jgi:cobalt-precorrin 5A hydrolase/precorrin-3B C17-methyltransferase
MRVLSISVTDAGRALAERLPYQRSHGAAGDTIRREWGGVDAFVVFLATGAVVRLIAPLLADKREDPAVVCVDDAGRYVIALTGGHAGGANDLARDVATLLGAEPVITTATDGARFPALDQLPGFAAAGDIAGVTTAALNGNMPVVDNERGWPLPAALTSNWRQDSRAQQGDLDASSRIVVTDRVTQPSPGTAVLHPPSLVIGVGTSLGAPAEDVAALVADALGDAGLARQSVAEVATIDRRRTEPAVVALGLAVRCWTAAELAGVRVPSPSDDVRDAVGTPSVAEAAALLAAGADAELLVPKRKNAVATIAIARRARPRGRVVLVGLGPGGVAHRTPAAAVAVRAAEVVIGYGPYVDQAADLLSPAHDVQRSPIGDEVVRAKQALVEAGAGRSVAVVCSGDAGVYAMASIVCELAGDLAPDVDIEVVPGVTAALAAAAALGAPLGHDHAAVSLSDLLTPWEVIERRLRAVAESDLVVTLYNPRSRGRDWQLEAARRILLERRPSTTPVGIVADVTRPAERVVTTTLAELDVEQVHMTTCVVIGSSTTRLVAGRIVTPRGYQA